MMKSASRRHRLGMSFRVPPPAAEETKRMEQARQAQST
jgi:hypothetical protein